jgi:hypothetical protein
VTEEERAERLRQMVARLNKLKKEDEAMVSNWEVDRYYEDNLKKYDTE